MAEKWTAFPRIWCRPLSKNKKKGRNFYKIFFCSISIQSHPVVIGLTMLASQNVRSKIVRRSRGGPVVWATSYWSVHVISIAVENHRSQEKVHRILRELIVHVNANNLSHLNVDFLQLGRVHPRHLS